MSFAAATLRLTFAPKPLNESPENSLFTSLITISPIFLIETSVLSSSFVIFSRMLKSSVDKSNFSLLPPINSKIAAKSLDLTEFTTEIICSAGMSMSNLFKIWLISFKLFILNLTKIFANSR